MKQSQGTILDQLQEFEHQLKNPQPIQQELDILENVHELYRIYLEQIFTSYHQTQEKSFENYKQNYSEREYRQKTGFFLNRFDWFLKNSDQENIQNGEFTLNYKYNQQDKISQNKNSYKSPIKSPNLTAIHSPLKLGLQHTNNIQEKVQKPKQVRQVQNKSQLQNYLHKNIQDDQISSQKSQYKNSQKSQIIHKQKPQQHLYNQIGQDNLQNQQKKSVTKYDPFKPTHKKTQSVIVSKIPSQKNEPQIPSDFKVYTKKRTFSFIAQNFQQVPQDSQKRNISPNFGAQPDCLSDQKSKTPNKNYTPQKKKIIAQKKNVFSNTFQSNTQKNSTPIKSSQIKTNKTPIKHKIIQQKPFGCGQPSKLFDNKVKMWGLRHEEEMKKKPSKVIKNDPIINTLQNLLTQNGNLQLNYYGQIMIMYSIEELHQYLEDNPTLKLEIDKDHIFLVNKSGIGNQSNNMFKLQQLQKKFESNKHDKLLYEIRVEDMVISVYTEAELIELLETMPEYTLEIDEQGYYLKKPAEQEEKNLNDNFNYLDQQVKKQLEEEERIKQQKQRISHLRHEDEDKLSQIINKMGVENTQNYISFNCEKSQQMPFQYKDQPEITESIHIQITTSTIKDQEEIVNQENSYKINQNPVTQQEFHQEQEKYEQHQIMAESMNFEKIESIVLDKYQPQEKITEFSIKVNGEYKLLQSKEEIIQIMNQDPTLELKLTESGYELIKKVENLQINKDEQVQDIRNIPLESFQSFNQNVPEDKHDDSFYKHSGVIDMDDLKSSQYDSKKKNKLIDSDSFHNYRQDINDSFKNDSDTNKVSTSQKNQEEQQQQIQIEQNQQSNGHESHFIVPNGLLQSQKLEQSQQFQQYQEKFQSQENNESQKKQLEQVLLRISQDLKDDDQQMNEKLPSIKSSRLSLQNYLSKENYQENNEQIQIQPEKVQCNSQRMIILVDTHKILAVLVKYLSEKDIMILSITNKQIWDNIQTYYKYAINENFSNSVSQLSSNLEQIHMDSLLDIKYLENESLLTKLMQVISKLYDNQGLKSVDEFQDHVLKLGIMNIEPLLDSKFEKILIIYFIMTEKYSYLKIDNKKMDINLVDLSFFEKIDILTILEKFIFDASLDDNKLFLIRMILDVEDLDEIIDHDLLAKIHLHDNITKNQSVMNFYFQSKKPFQENEIFKTIVSTFVINLLMEDYQFFSFIKMVVEQQFEKEIKNNQKRISALKKRYQKSKKSVFKLKKIQY